jgi:hypothetical protein
VPATGLAEQFVANWRIAAVALAILTLVAIAVVALRPSSRTEAVVTTSPPESVGSTAQGPATQEPVTQAAATAGDASLAAIGASEKAGSEMLSLTFEVRRPVWLRVNADGGVDPGRTYQQDERHTIQATREIMLRAGDAGAVFVSIGGGALVPLGPDGQVRTRRFGHEGATAADRDGERPTPTPASEVPPLARSIAGAAAGAEPNAVPDETGADQAAVSTSTADQPEHVVTAADYAAATEREILERHQRWFDAFERGDRATMASLAADNFSLLDQRPAPAPTVSGRIERTLHDLRVQVTAGIGAVVSGRITETTTTDGAPAATVALYSEVWIRQGEEWQLVSVRLVPLNAVQSPLQ